MDSIKQGKVLKKVEEGNGGEEKSKVEEKEEAGGMGFNIAMILARREAMEFTDSDEENEDEWEDDEDE